MDEQQRKAHWERVWAERDESSTSWFQDRPDVSLGFIERSGLPRGEPLIDVGGGASRLVDHLLELGFTDLTVLDLAAAGLQRAQRRLGARAHRVHWIENDVTCFRPRRTYRLWHDRAVFHFLRDADDRARYVAAMDAALAVNGEAVIATFGPDGPLKCSGLETVRYGANELAAELGPRWRLVEELVEAHRTPAGREQQFGYYRFARGSVQASETR